MKNKKLFHNIIFMTLVTATPTLFIHHPILEFMKVSWGIIALILLQKIDFDALDKNEQSEE